MAEREDEGMVVAPVESSCDLDTDPEARNSLVPIDGICVHCRRRAWGCVGLTRA